MVNHYRWDFIGLSSQTKPTPATSEKVVDGSTFYEGDTSKLYVFCKNNWYEKTAAGGGGGTSDFDQLTNRPKYNGTAMTSETNIPLAPTVVQTSGDSETDVMSQNATTSLLYKDPATKNQVVIGGSTNQTSTSDNSVIIGKNATANNGGGNTPQGNVTIGGSARTDNRYSIGIGCKVQAKGYGSIAIGGSGTSTRVEASKAGGIAIGETAVASEQGSIALGAFSSSSTTGEMNIGSADIGLGYNSSNYRLISGVYDGQGAHDVVTVGQINNLIDAINTAGSFNLNHIGA